MRELLDMFIDITVLVFGWCFLLLVVLLGDPGGGLVVFIGVVDVLIVCF